MLYAAMLSGCVIAQSGTTLVHGMGYYFTLEFGLAHGLANALLLTPLFQYNAHHCPGRVAAIAAALGQPCEPVPASAAKAVADALHSLLESLGVSPAATDAGVDPARMAWCADEIFPDRARFKNQPGDPTRDEVLRFFEAACAGRVEHGGA
jgi:alcohol dehydrogenase class IV